MEESDPLNKPHFSNLKPRKYHSLYNCSLIILALVLLSLFPSQPPQFLNHTFISKLWELIHLLFIGIGVCYGFFCLRNTPIEPILDTNERYLSGFSQFSSIFDYGFENVSWYDEKFMVQYPENGYEFLSTSNEKIISQTQKYDYGKLNGESLARENCVLDDMGKPKLVAYNNPLNLPVRSLISKVKENCYDESAKELRTNLGSVRFCEENNKNRKSEIRGLIPINLEKKFEEAVALPSPIPWSSRSSRISEREKCNPSLHKRLLSVGNVGFSSLGDIEKLNSQSKPNTTNVDENGSGSEVNGNMGVRTSLAHSRELLSKELDLMNAKSKSKQIKVRDEKRNAKSPPCLRPSSVGEFGNNEKKLESIVSRMETRGKEVDVKSVSQSESFWSSIFSPTGSPSPNKSSRLSPILTEELDPKFEDLKKKDSSISSFATTTEQMGMGSSFEMKLVRNCDISVKTFSKSGRQDNREKVKPAASTKSLSRGKSVRTIRTNKICLDKNVEKMNGCDLEKVSLDESLKSGGLHNDKRQESCRSTKAKTEKISLDDIENIKGSSDKEADSVIANNEELDSDEVDKKADAFIAKFREQIRLQKIESIKKKRL